MFYHIFGMFSLFAVVSLIILIFYLSSPNGGAGGSKSGGDDPFGPPLGDPGVDDPDGPINDPDPDEKIKIIENEDVISREYISEDDEDDEKLEPAFNIKEED